MADETLKDINQFLTFTLGKEIFALDIGTVREVLELTSITKIPRTPKFMRGVINLRGHAVPVVDMRLKLGMSQGEDFRGYLYHHRGDRIRGRVYDYGRTGRFGA